MWVELSGLPIELELRGWSLRMDPESENVYAYHPRIGWAKAGDSLEEAAANAWAHTVAYDEVQQLIRYQGWVQRRRNLLDRLEHREYGSTRYHGNYVALRDDARALMEGRAKPYRTRSRTTIWRRHK